MQLLQLGLQKIYHDRRLLDLERIRNHLDFEYPDSGFEARSHAVRRFQSRTRQAGSSERNHQIQLRLPRCLPNNFEPDLLLLFHGRKPTCRIGARPLKVHKPFVGSSSRILLRSKAIAHPRFGEEIFRFGWERLDFLAQLIDKNAQVFHFIAIVGTPYGLE